MSFLYPCSFKRFVFLPLAAISVASAAPAWQKQLTSPNPGKFQPLQPSVLDLQLSWKGIVNSGRIRVEFAPKDARKPGALVVRSSAASVGAASSLYPYQGNFWSEIHPDSLHPRFFQGNVTNKERSATTVTRYHSNRVDWKETSTPVGTTATTTRNGSFRHHPVYDIYSAMLHVRSQRLHDGDAIAIVVQSFRTPYLLQVKVLGREIHAGRNTIRLSVGMQKIDSDTRELMPYKKLKRDVTLWLSDDTDRIPVEFRAAVFIGDVRATLANFRKL